MHLVQVPVEEKEVKNLFSVIQKVGDTSLSIDGRRILHDWSITDSLRTWSSGSWALSTRLTRSEVKKGSARGFFQQLRLGIAD